MTPITEEQLAKCDKVDPRWCTEECDDANEKIHVLAAEVRRLTAELTWMHEEKEEIKAALGLLAGGTGLSLAAEVRRLTEERDEARRQIVLTDYHALRLGGEDIKGFYLRRVNRGDYWGATEADRLFPTEKGGA